MVTAAQQPQSTTAQTDQLPPAQGVSDPTEPGVEIPAELKDKYTRKLPKQALGLRLAHEAMCMQDLQQVLQMDRATINAHHVSALGELAGIDQGSGGGDDMGIHVGDIVINNSTPPASQGAPATGSIPPPSPAPVPPVQEPPAASGAAATGLSNLAKAGILAATLGAGSALPPGISAIANYFSGKAAPSVAATPEPGAWQLQLVPPEPGSGETPLAN